jgi:serine/threonine protein phosphatase PrpC
VVAALRRERPEYLLHEEEGYLYEEWREQDGSLCSEACDGGTTATVVCLIDGALLVQAQCGDSTALLGGILEGEPTFEELITEHSATHADEFTRVQDTRRGKELQFVYDVPELIDQDKAPHVFRSTPTGPELDVKSKRVAEAHRTEPRTYHGPKPSPQPLAPGP